jgi:hypothetical protein
MTIWIIVDQEINQKTYVPFETEQAAKRYVKAFGKPEWKVAPIIPYSEKEVEAIIYLEID